MGMIVQSLVFDSRMFTPREALEWAHGHGFGDHAKKTHVVGDHIRVRLFDPEEFDPKSFRTMEMHPGVQAVVAKFLDSPRKNPEDKGFDHGILNTPLSKRGITDSQIDSNLKRMAAESKVKMKAANQEWEEKRAEAQRLLDLMPIERLKEISKSHKQTAKQVKKVFEEVIWKNPDRIIRMMEKELAVKSNPRGAKEELLEEIKYKMQVLTKRIKEIGDMRDRKNKVKLKVLKDALMSSDVSSEMLTFYQEVVNSIK
jgi:hypothetical protein